MPAFQKDQYLTLLTPDNEILEQIALQGTLTTPDLLGIRAIFNKSFPEIPEFRLKILTAGETRQYFDEDGRKKLKERQEAERARMRQKLKEKRENEQ